MRLALMTVIFRRDPIVLLRTSVLGINDTGTRMNASRSQSTSQSERVALCDLAVNDPEVVQDHDENKAIIGGWYKTLFAIAFLVRLPVDGDAIIRAWSPTERPFFPQLQVSITSIQRKGAEASGMQEKQRG